MNENDGPPGDFRSAECSSVQSQSTDSVSIELHHKGIVESSKRLELNQFFPQKEPDWPRKIVSGVQPTGILHIGNYFGAVKRWVDFQEAGENVSYFLADLHSITMPHVSDIDAMRGEMMANFDSVAGTQEAEARHPSNGGHVASVRNRSPKISPVRTINGAATCGNVLDPWLCLGHNGSISSAASIQGKVSHVEHPR